MHHDQREDYVKRFYTCTSDHHPNFELFWAGLDYSGGSDEGGSVCVQPSVVPNQACGLFQLREFGAKSSRRAGKGGYSSSTTATVPRTWKRKRHPGVETPQKPQPSVAVKLPAVVLTPALLRARRQAWFMRFSLVRPRVWVFHSHLHRELLLARPRVHRLPPNRVSVTRVRYHHLTRATLKPASHALVMVANLNKRPAWLKTPHVG